MSDKHEIRVVLIGYGYVGKTFHAPLITSDKRMRLVAVVSRDPAKVHADFPDVTVYAEALQAVREDSVDMVVIASPNDTHAPLARAALEAGKHVVVDKPFMLTLKEAQEVVALAQEKKRLLAVFHNRRWDSDFLSIKAQLEAGEIGRVVHFESHIDRFRPEVQQRWRESNAPGSGVWFDLGPHLIDQALQLFGRPTRIVSSLAQLRDGAMTDDWAHVVLEYEALRVVLHASTVVASGAPRFVAHGTKGSVIKQKADPQEAQLIAGMAPGAPGWGRDDDPIRRYDAQGQVTDEEAHLGDQRGFYRAVAAALLEGAPNPVPPEQAVAVMEVLEVAAQSARMGQAAFVAS